jgi:hypothetical protein
MKNPLDKLFVRNEAGVRGIELKNVSYLNK